MAKKKTRGPAPDVLKIDGDWKAAVAHVLTVKPEPKAAPKLRKKKTKGA